MGVIKMGSPYLLDDTLKTIVGLKNPDNSEQLFSQMGGNSPELNALASQQQSQGTQIDALEQDPANGVVAWTVPAKQFDLVQGTPTYGAITGRLGGWQFAQQVASYIASELTLPSHWLTMDVYVQWVNMVANAGNVVLGGEIHKWGVGDSINVTPVGGSGIFAANPTPWVVTESKVAADLVLDPSKNTTLRIARQGASGNDTLTANSIAILAVRLVKKT